MGSGIFFPVCALPIILIIVISFNIKQHIKTEETKIFNSLIVINLIGLVIEVLCSYACFISKEYYHLSNFILKSYLVYLIVWTDLFTVYIYRISGNVVSRFKKILHNIILLTISIIIYILPINLVMLDFNQGQYTTGPSVNFTYIISFIYILFILIVLFKNMKDIKNKKYLPVFLFLIIGAIAILIQRLFPHLLLLTYSETLICLCMYFTIENPDVKMIAQLNEAKDIAERSNRAKSDFLSSMSHEIRTPLNAIVGLSEDNLYYKDVLPKEVLENSKDIQNASQTLLEIVGNILDINKIESEKMEIVNIPYNFTKEISSLVKVTSTRIGDKSIDFVMNLAEDIPYELIGDKAHVKSVVNNLLTNAIKYTEQGKIEFTVKCINKENICNLIIIVKDTGRGIKKEDIEKLFNKFERLDIEKNSTAEGTGLGLAITKSLIELMGGKINVQSNIGEGSIFMVNLPQKISKMYKPVNEEDLYNTSNILLKAKENDIDFSNMRVLIVDDNKLNIKVAKKALGSFNFIIDESYDGLECVNRIKAGYKYDLILMDIMMPNMSGETALKELKQIDGFSTPVIALTADALAGSRERYMGLGFADYLAKPFSREQIKEKLDIIFKQNTKPMIEEDRFKNAPTYIFGADSIEDIYKIGDK